MAQSIFENITGSLPKPRAKSLRADESWNRSTENSLEEHGDEQLTPNT